MAGALVEGSVVSQLYTALMDMPLLRAKSKGKGMMAWQVCAHHLSLCVCVCVCVYYTMLLRFLFMIVDIDILLSCVGDMMLHC